MVVILSMGLKKPRILSNIMIRANIKSSDEVYIGLIDEVDEGFCIVWNKNIAAYPGVNRTGENRCFQSYEEACENVYKVMQDATISETIYFKRS